MYSRASHADCPSAQYVHLITRMLYDEPCVLCAVTTLQAHCLRHGVSLRWGDTPPTPSFQRHIREHYEPFCRDAIQSFMAVGFAPFRLRREGNNTVPEVLPFGTYTWTVARNPQQPHPDRGGGRWPPHEQPPPAKRARAPENPPLLRYDVVSSHCDDPIHVCNFVPPHAHLTCVSPLASLVTHYAALTKQRRLAERVEEWNSRPNMALEEADKTYMNEVLQRGGAIQTPHGGLYAGMEQDARVDRLQAVSSLVHMIKEQEGVPDDTTVFVAPKNQTVRPLERTEAPPDMVKRELYFARAVAIALGIPPSFTMQGTSAIASTSSAGRGSWNESPEIFSRALADTCRHINRRLEALLTMAYRGVYGAEFDLADGQPAPGAPRRMPVFSVPHAPTLPMEQLLPLFDAKLLDDACFSQIVEVSLGFPLSRTQAAAAREDRHRAANVLPFKDRKDAPR